MTKPLDADEMRALLQRYLPQIAHYDAQAAELRKRVVNGDHQISNLRSRLAQGLDTDGVTEEDLLEADERLSALRLALRESDAWVCIGVAMQLSRGVAALLAEAGQDDGWQPPDGSMLRIYMPGLVNLSIDLHDQRYPKANS